MLLSALFFSDYLFGLELKPVNGDFQHDFARMTDEADTSGRGIAYSFKGL